MDRHPRDVPVILDILSGDKWGKSHRSQGKTAQLDFRERKGLEEEGNEVWVPAKGIVDGEEVELTGALLKPE